MGLYSSKKVIVAMQWKICLDKKSLKQSTSVRYEINKAKMLKNDRA